MAEAIASEIAGSSRGILLAWTGGFGKDFHWGSSEVTRDGSRELLKATRSHFR